MSSVVSLSATLAVPAGKSTGGPHQGTGLPVSLTVTFQPFGTAFSRASTTANQERPNEQFADKTVRLVRRFHALFPDIRLEPAFAWAGTFGSTKDGLGYIGRHPCFPRAYFALGFGGNGITFSEIASRILTDLFLGKRTGGEEKIFRFDR